MTQKELVAQIKELFSYIAACGCSLRVAVCEEGKMLGRELDRVPLPVHQRETTLTDQEAADMMGQAARAYRKHVFGLRDDIEEIISTLWTEEEKQEGEGKESST